MINRKTEKICLLFLFCFIVLSSSNLFATEYQIINISGAGGVKVSDIIKDSRHLYEKTKLPVEIIFPSGERKLPKVLYYSDKDFNDLRTKMQGLIASKPDVHYIFVVNSQGWVPFSKLAPELKALGIKDRNYDVILNQPVGKLATGFIPNKFPHQTFSFDKLESRPRLVVNLKAPDVATRDKFDEPNFQSMRNYIDVQYGPITDNKKWQIITNEIDKHSIAVGSGLTHEIPQVIKILSNRSLVSKKNTFEELFSNIKVELSMGRKLRENYRDQALRMSGIIPHSKQATIPAVAKNVQEDIVNLYWTDSGISPWLKGEPTKNMKLGDDFGTHNINPIILDVDKRGQLLIPMPSDKDLPETDQQWNELSKKIYTELKGKIDRGLKNGVKDFELRTVQNINVPGYFYSSKRQKKVTGFIKAYNEALYMVKEDLTSSGNNVKVKGIWGSNGGYAAAKVLSESNRISVDRGVLVDARAYKQDVKSLYYKLNGKLSIINTAGDAPSLGDMVANHNASKSLKRELPNLRVIWSDAKGLDIFIKQHIKSLNPESQLKIKEYNGNGYNKLGIMKGGDLIKTLLMDSKIASSKHNTISGIKPTPKNTSDTGGVIGYIRGKETEEVTGKLEAEGKLAKEAFEKASSESIFTEY